MKLRSIFLATVTSMLLLCPPVQAEDLLEKTFDLEFRGGTVEEYVDAIRNSVGEVNIVVMPEATELYLEPFTLHQVDLYAAINLLEGLSEKTATRTVEIETDLAETYTAEANEIIVIHANVKQHTYTTQKTYLVITVQDLFIEDGFTHEDLATAIETAMAISTGNLDEPEIRFHEETGLIIARGHPEQMDTIGQVIEQLREGIMREQNKQAAVRHAEKQDTIRQLELAIHKRDLMIEELEQEISRLNREIDEMEKE